MSRHHFAAPLADRPLIDPVSLTVPRGHPPGDPKVRYSNVASIDGERSTFVVTLPAA